MSSINSVRKLQILYFSKKNKKIKNLKNGEKKWPNIGIYTYHSSPPTPLVFNRGFTIPESQSKSFSREAIHLLLNWSFGLLLIGPLIYQRLILQKVLDFRRIDELAFCPPRSWLVPAALTSGLGIYGNCSYPTFAGH